MYQIETQDGLFHDGDGISELGTVLPASWLNQIQQELIAILKEAGINPDKKNVNQVVAAIKAIIQKNKAANASIADIAKLAEKITARTIGGISFDGSQDIDLPGVNIKGNQDTTGNATSASRLENAVNINGILFDGTKDINATPAGAVMFFAMKAAPVGWLPANGAAISRTTYANLFSAIGTLYGAGDGNKTFNLPDLRGEFLRSWDSGRGLDGGRQFASLQDSQNLGHNHDGVTAESGWHMHTGWTSVNGEHSHGIPISSTSAGANFESNGGNTERWGSTAATGNHNHYFETNVGGNHIHSFSTNFNGGNESRPRNIALLACIKI